MAITNHFTFDDQQRLLVSAVSATGGGGGAGEGTMTVDASGNLLVTAAGGMTATATFTPAAAAYLANDIMGATALFTFNLTSGDPVAAGSLVRILTSEVKIDIAAVPAGQGSYVLHLYSATPPSAQADNDAWTLASADLPSYMGSLNLGVPADLGACNYIKTQSLDFDIRLVTAGAYGRLVTTGAHTATAVARTVILHAVTL